MFGFGKKKGSMLDEPEFKEKIKSEITPLLKSLYEEDEKIRDDFENMEVDQFDETENVPMFMGAREIHGKIVETLLVYGADKGALKDMGSDDVSYNLGEVLEPTYRDGLGEINKKEVKKSSYYMSFYRRIKGNDYLETSAKFKKYLMINLGIEDDKVKPVSDMTSSPLVSYENRPSNHSEVDESPVDLEKIKLLSNEISELFKYDSKYAGEISTTLNKGADMVSRSSLPEEIVRDYLEAKNYYSKVSTDQLITKTDSSVNMLKKLSNNLNSYFATLDN